MTSLPFREKLRSRLAANSLAIAPEQVSQLDRYFQSLLQWNRKINLTGFDLDPISDQAIDRLFCEPLAAVAHFPGAAKAWVDVGSGGGSPALPIKIAIPSLPLTLVETRDRKCAFLRDVARDLGSVRTTVLNQRFEDASAGLDRADVITLRAVRAYPRLSQAVDRVLVDGGLVLVFGEVNPLDWPHFASIHVEVTQLLQSNQSRLSVLKKPSR